MVRSPLSESHRPPTSSQLTSYNGQRTTDQGHQMRCTQTLIPTQKETPADAVIVSHQLMIRAGLIRQLTAGAYDFLPLGLRSLYKAAAIVREEMDRIGGAEVLFPGLTPRSEERRVGKECRS